MTWRTMNSIIHTHIYTKRSNIALVQIIPPNANMLIDWLFHYPNSFNNKTHLLVRKKRYAREYCCAFAPNVMDHKPPKKEHTQFSYMFGVKKSFTYSLSSTNAFYTFDYDNFTPNLLNTHLEVKWVIK